MPITISGSTGIAGVDGSASTPAVQGTDTNTGIVFPAADTVAVATGGSERMRIDSSGNVGIGTSSPSARLQAYGTSGTAQSRLGTANGYLEVTAFDAGPVYCVVNGASHTSAVFGSQSNTPTVFFTNNTERMRIDTSGNVGIGTSSPTYKLQVGNHNGYNDQFSVYNDGTFSTGGVNLFNYYNGTTNICGFKFASVSSTTGAILMYTNAGSGVVERARIDSSGSFMVNTTSAIVGAGNTSTGFGIEKASDGCSLFISRDTNVPAYVNRNNDGALINFDRSGTAEGNVSVSGTTVSFNGGHLARWSQLPSGQRDPALLKGTVLSNLDEMCVWLDEHGNPLPNEQLNKTKISDIEGDPNVAGVFVSWDNDDQTYTDDMNVAMTGDMIIRIAQGVVVQKGDLLMSAGDGTAKPQGDDIRRSKTVAKVTSNHVTCTYADGSYCVPCVLMAC